MKNSLQNSWLPVAAAVLALLSIDTAQAGNRYDERKVDSRYEARGDNDEERAGDEEAAADTEASGSEESDSANEETGDSPGDVADSTQDDPAPEAAGPGEQSEVAADDFAPPEETAEPGAPLPPLPDPAEVAVVLSTGLFDGTREPMNPGMMVDANVPSVWAEVTIGGDGDHGLAGRIVVADVEGLEPGAEVAASSCDEWIDQGQRSVALSFNAPLLGFAPGRYRVEVTENAMPRRILGIATFSAQLVRLPPDARLRIGVHESAEAPEVLTSAELPSRMTKFNVTLETLDPTTLDLQARLFVEEAVGLMGGRKLAELPAGRVLELRPDSARATVEITVPRFGLPPGRYRLELSEAIPPYRLVKKAMFTTAEGAEAAGPFNLADPEFGGLLESSTGEDGAGLTWAWAVLRPANTTVWRVGERGAGPVLPCELVVSFYKRELAMVSAVEVVPEGDSCGLRTIEVWGAMVSARDGFQKVAERSFPADGGGPLVVPVPDSLMRFVKIRFVAAQLDRDDLGVTAIRVHEAAAAGYQPLRQRHPDIRDWRLQPRNAAQQGLFFLQASGAQFQRENSCMGCHVQSQALMGLSVARKNDYVVSGATERLLADFTTSCQTEAGDIRRQTDVESSGGETTNTVFGALGLSYSHSTPETARGLVASARWLAGQQDPEGFLPPDAEDAPVVAGEILHTAHALEVWAAALTLGGDPALRQNLDRALAWMLAAPAETTQDRVFKVLMSVRHGGAPGKKLARQLCQQLLAEQGGEGAWRVDPLEPESAPSPFATGQVLYALRQAGFSPAAPSFQRGVQWLLCGQDPDAAWRSAEMTSPFASTMWPVIALTGSFSSKAEPAKINVTALARPAPPPPAAPPPVAVAAKTMPKAILLVFDCSFSMTEKIRGRAKFDIAKEVLREVINKLPDDTKVGLRLYGHRHGSMTSESRTDTQLVVPIGPLERAKLLQTIAAAKALGQTPMVLSTLAAGEDLKKAGGGILIVVTDGAESCGGKPRKAGALLAGLGVPLRLDVIGFALTGRRVVDEMTAFTAPTGGRFYTAADGLQLATALKEAVSPAPPAARPPTPPPPPPPEPEDYAYEVFDAQGLSVAKSSTLSGEPPELAPGVYRVALSDGAQTTALDGLKLAEGQTLELRYDPATGVLEYMP